MIRIIRDTLRWQERDIPRMAGIIGDEAAVTMRAPVNQAIVRVAQRRGIKLSPRAANVLEVAALERAVAQHAKILDAPLPPATGLERRAWAHQRAALRFFRDMARPGYLVADGTGVGKTLQALLWAHTVIDAKRTLIITTNGAKDQWADAIHEFIDQCAVVTVVDGTIAEQVAQASTRTGWVVGHWESLTHAAKGYRKHAWDAVILDEAHHIGNRDAQRSQNARRLITSHRMALTAHPFSNHPGELWTILRFLYPEQYTSYWRFFYMHVNAKPKAFGGFEIAPDGAKRPNLLRWELAPFTLERTKLQVYKSLPKIVRTRRTVRLTERGQREYDKLKVQFFAELDALDGGQKILPIINDLSRLTRLRQYIVDPGLLGAREASLKYAEVLSLMQDLDGPPVIFTSFREAAVRLGAVLTKHKYSVAHINGHVGRDARRLAKRQFLAGTLDALIVVTQAGGSALNLGKYGRVIFLDLPWTPRDLEQAEGRVDRPEEGTGKLVATTAYRIIVRGTYEERLEAKLVQKHATFTKVFTVTDLKELFA